MPMVVAKPNYHALVKNGNRYTFRPDPNDRKRCRVSFSQPAPNRNGFVNVSIPVREARELYRFLTEELGYERP